MEEEIIEYFVNMTKLSRECEILKQLINEKDECEPYAVFTRIDRLNKGWIDSNDLIDFLKDCNYFTNDKKSVNLFIEYYDRDFDNKLDFHEFLSFILNKTNSILRAISTQKQTFKISSNEYLPTDFEDNLKTLLLKEFYLFNYADKKKLEIFLEKFDLLQLFLDIDENKDGYICSIDLDYYLRKRDVVLYKEEINSIISIYDEDLDGRLSWNEFLFLILPSKNNYNYDHGLLRAMEIEHANIYYESLRKEKLFQIGNTLITNTDTNTTVLDPKIKNYINDNVTEPIDDYNSGFNSFKVFIRQIFELNSIDREIEAVKVRLSYQTNFNLISIFKFFDKYKFDKVTFDNFIDGLEYFDIVPSSNSIKDFEMFFKKFDKHCDGKINYSQFIEIFLPKSSEEAIIMTRRKPYENYRNFLDFNLKDILNELFVLHLQAESYLYLIKSNLDFKYITDLFNFLDIDNNGFLTLNELKKLFDRNELHATYNDLMLLMDRFDRNKDGKISLVEV